MTDKVESPTVKYDKANMHIPEDMSSLPEPQEISAVILLMKHFRSDISFISKRSSKTPDIIIGNIRWEIKSPTGKGKRNIQHQFQESLKQSVNIVFDARRSKIRIEKIRTEVTKQAKNDSRIKRLLLIEKTGKIVVIK